MDEDHFNTELRKFLKEVGVTSQREVERVVRGGSARGGRIRLVMTLTSPDAPDLHHVVERAVALEADRPAGESSPEG